MAMTMSSYVTETTFAVTQLVDTIWHERDELARIGAEVDKLTEQTIKGYVRAADLALDDLDDELMATSGYWETYQGVDTARIQGENQRAFLAAQIGTHGFSIGALSGAVLQIAKQGISVVHGGPGAPSGKPAGTPPGRAIGSQELSTVIWEARNQAMHWDAGRLLSRGKHASERLPLTLVPSLPTTRRKVWHSR
jgi:hypothetical protein